MIIESKLGPGEQTVGGQTYVFTKDNKGRFTTKVTNLVHVQCFLSIEHYLPVEDEALVTAAPVAKQSNVSVTEKQPATDAIQPADKTPRADKKPDEKTVKSEVFV